MFIKLMLISIILVAFVMLALGIKMWFNHDAEFTSHSCALPDEKGYPESGCASCDLKNTARCTELQTDKKEEQ